MRRMLAVLALLLAAAACFSDRDPVAFTLADCSLPLDSATIGNLGIVVIRNFTFTPSELRVAPGTRVTWINCETEANARAGHTSTADDGESWSSPLLPFEGTYSVVLEEAGSFDYYCVPHPSMRGRIIVE